MSCSAVEYVRLLLAALAELHRVRVLAIATTHRAAVLLADALRCPAPNLREYNVHLMVPGADEQEFNDSAPSCVVNSQNMPRLHTLEMSGFCRTLPWHGIRNMASLKTFSVSLSEAVPDRPLDQLLECLGDMRALEILTVNLSRSQMNSLGKDL